MPSAHSGQGQQLCSFFSDMAVRFSRATCGKVGLVEALVLNLGSEVGSCGLLGGGNLFQEAMCGLGQHYLRLGKQRWLCHILTEQERKGKSGVERALDLAAAVWSWFYKKVSRKYLRIVMCK